MLVSTILIAELQPKHMSNPTGPLSPHGGGRGYPSTNRKVLGVQQLPANLLFCPGQGAHPTAYLVVGVGIEQSLLVAQLGWGGQQDVLQVPLHQRGKQQCWGLLQMLSCWQARVWS